MVSRKGAKTATPGPMAWRHLGGKQNLAGWDSSHTTPFGAAVPARPPTRCQQVTRYSREAQWTARAKNLGTRVLVLAERVLRDASWPAQLLIRNGLRLCDSRLDISSTRFAVWFQTNRVSSRHLGNRQDVRSMR
jgi:hypothetical protein